MGVSFNRTTVNLYSDFYNTDILIASPLGLRLIVGGEGEGGKEFDFLSSLEVVVVDQVEAMMMQNWEHMQTVFQHLNLRPEKVRNTDFSRLRKCECCRMLAGFGVFFWGGLRF